MSVKVNNPDFNITEFSYIRNESDCSAMLVHQELPQNERLLQLNTIAITQMKSFISVGGLQKRLEQ